MVREAELIQRVESAPEPGGITAIRFGSESTIARLDKFRDGGCLFWWPSGRGYGVEFAKRMRDALTMAIEEAESKP